MRLNEIESVLQQNKFGYFINKINTVRIQVNLIWLKTFLKRSIKLLFSYRFNV